RALLVLLVVLSGIIFSACSARDRGDEEPAEAPAAGEATAPTPPPEAPPVAPAPAPAAPDPLDPTVVAGRPFTVADGGKRTTYADACLVAIAPRWKIVAAARPGADPCAVTARAAALVVEAEVCAAAGPCALPAPGTTLAAELELRAGYGGEA